MGVTIHLLTCFGLVVSTIYTIGGGPRSQGLRRKWPHSTYGDSDAYSGALHWKESVKR